jgi:predicted double-glycine peptidase
MAARAKRRSAARLPRLPALLAACLLMSSPASVAGSHGTAPPVGWQQEIVLQQQDVTCGAAALATMLRLSGRMAPPQPEIVAALLDGRTLDDIRRRGGFSLLDLQRYLAEQGVASYGETGLDLGAVLERAPVIAPLAIGGGRFHYVVVVGQAGGRIAVANPASGPEWLAQGDFLKAWDGIIFRFGKPGARSG